MANTFYIDACNVDTKITPYTGEIEPIKVATGGEGKNNLMFHKPKYNKKLQQPHSIMNENVAINYRTIYNGYSLASSTNNFTQFDDYQKCMQKDKFMAEFLRDKRNPTYTNIIKYYSGSDFDPYGLARYKMQDFIYLKYYNQIPNNYMVTLRRYTRPCEDHMFGIDMLPVSVNGMNGYHRTYMAIATAVTYLGEKAGNKLSDILKFDYGANWEDKEGKTESIQNPDGGLAAQMRERGGIGADLMSGEAKLGGSNSITQQARSLIKFSAMAQGKGVSVAKAMASQHAYEGNAFNARYGEELYGDVNVINKVKIRSRGLTFSNSFSLNFEYSLKSLKCVNPRIAMMDIMSNFLILTGNYGEFWGGATIFYGQRNIAPQFGDPEKLRNGDYGGYISSLVGDIKEGFKHIKGDSGDFFADLWTGIKNIGSGFLQGLVGNLLGGNIGVAGQSVVPQALLSGAPSGFWHLTVGNPLDPIAVMGNMAVTKTSVQFNDALGYDDFPTEVKFTVELEHCRPRDNAGIESMFNGGKGRFYSFTDKNLLAAYHHVDTMGNFQGNGNLANQERNTSYDKNAQPHAAGSSHAAANSNWIKTIGGFLNG